jgi:hypothetical protein
MYKASATFTVETYTNQNGYTFFYDNNTAQQMARTFPHLLDSNLLLDKVKADLGKEILNGVASAEGIKNSNLFTINVTSNSPQDAYDILLAFIDNYPSVSEYVVGRTQLNMIDMPKLPSEPYNQSQHKKSVLYGIIVGAMICVIIILILGLIALNNFGNLFKTPKPPEEEIAFEEEPQDVLPSFDPYLMLQNNQTNTDDFYQQEMQFTSAVDKKKSEIINSILENPEEAARILTSYIKE